MMQQTLPQDAQGDLLAVPSADCSVHVSVYGNAGLPPLVLLHGLFQASRCWKKQIPYFSQYYRLIIPDFPGHGRSPEGFSTGLSARSLGEILHAILDAYVAPDQRAVVVAWSWAGVALRSALLMLGKRSVRGIVLTGTSLDMRPWFADPEVQQSMTAFQALFSADEEVRARAFFQYHRQLTFSPLPVEDYYETLGYNAVAYFSGGIGPEMLQPMDDPQETLYTHLPPTLIVQGRQDQVCLAKIGRLEHQRIPGSTYIEYDRCGHSPFLECPDIFNQTVHGWVQSLR